MIKEYLLNIMHKCYSKDKLTNMLLDTVTKQLNEAQIDITEVGEQIYLDTATWGLELLENELDIVGLNKTHEVRRDTIRAKWRGFGKLTAQLIKDTLESYEGVTVDVNFDGRLIITIKTIGTQSTMSAMENSIEDIKPAHLGVGLNYNYTINMKRKVHIGSALTQNTYEVVVPTFESINIGIGRTVYVGCGLAQNMETSIVAEVILPASGGGDIIGSVKVYPNVFIDKGEYINGRNFVDNGIIEKVEV